MSYSNNLYGRELVLKSTPLLRWRLWNLTQQNWGNFHNTTVLNDCHIYISCYSKEWHDGTKNMILFMFSVLLKARTFFWLLRLWGPKPCLVKRIAGFGQIWSTSYSRRPAVTCSSAHSGQPGTCPTRALPRRMEWFRCSWTSWARFVSLKHTLLVFYHK